MELILIYCVIGICVGMIAGLFGSGGGVVMVPTLYTIFFYQNLSPDQIMHITLATSLTIMIFTSLASAISHVTKTTAEPSVLFPLLLGIVLGMIAGGVATQFASKQILQMVFACVVFISAVYVFFRKKQPQDGKFIAKLHLMIPLGLLVGFLSPLLGIGGSVFIVPVFVWMKMHLQKAIQVSAISGVPIAILGAIIYWVLGEHVSNLPPQSFGFIYLPPILPIAIFSMLFSPLGTKLGTMFQRRTLQVAYSLLLFACAIHMGYFSFLNS